MSEGPGETNIKVGFTVSRGFYSTTALLGEYTSA